MLAEMPLQFWTYLLRPELLVSVGFVIICVVAVSVACWSQVARHRADAELKRDMVARGMSVEEIERVLAAKSRPGR